MEKFDLVIVGAGFAGMYGLHKFREIGLRVRVFEAGTDVGGTWYWNRYPGARCDVESRDYSYGLSEELEQEWEWSSRYPAQPEILTYLNHVADRFDLCKSITFNCRINESTFDEGSSLWSLKSENGSTISARFVAAAVGPFCTLAVSATGAVYSCGAN